MVICGIDYSMNAPGIVKANLNKDLDVISLEYRSFTKVKKTSLTDPNLIFYHKNRFLNNYDKAMWIRDEIINYMLKDKIDYCAIEGYSMNSKGIVFDIAESTMCTKLEVYNNYIPLRIYPPTVIKKFANVDGIKFPKKTKAKEKMNVLYNNYNDVKFDLKHLKDAVSPKEDIVDAFFCTRLLQMELKLRYGIVDLRSLPLKHIEIFNQVSKANPVNILTRDFLLKNELNKESK